MTIISTIFHPGCFSIFAFRGIRLGSKKRDTSRNVRSTESNQFSVENNELSVLLLIHFTLCIVYPQKNTPWALSLLLAGENWIVYFNTWTSWTDVSATRSIAQEHGEAVGKPSEIWQEGILGQLGPVWLTDHPSARTVLRFHTNGTISEHQTSDDNQHKPFSYLSHFPFLSSRSPSRQMPLSLKFIPLLFVLSKISNKVCNLLRIAKMYLKGSVFIFKGLNDKGYVRFDWTSMMKNSILVRFTVNRRKYYVMGKEITPF